MTQPGTADTIAANGEVANIADLWTGITQIRDKLPDYQKAHAYYEGTYTEVFASKRLQRKLGKAACDYMINLAKTPVKVVVNRLEITAVKVTGGNGGKNAKAQAALDALWKHNGLDGVGYKDLLRAAVKFGDEFVFVWPSKRVDNMVDILANDPTTTTIVYDDENPNVPLYAAKLWQEGTGKSARQRAELIYGTDKVTEGRIEKYITKPGAKGDQRQDWMRYQDDGDTQWPIPNPDPLPVFHLRNQKPWGVPAHKEAYGAQNAITKLVATEMANVDYHGAPIRYALQDPAVQDEDDLDDFGVDDAATEPEPEIDSHRSNFRSEPGDVWYMKGVKSVGQFDPADPAVLTDPLEIMVKLTAQQTDVAFHYFDPAGDIPSGESLKTADAPTADMVDTYEKSYTNPLVDILEHALGLMGHRNVTVTISWGPAEQVDDLEVQELVALKIANGIPPAVALMEAGYTQEQIDEWGVSKKSQPAERKPIAPGKNDLDQPFPAAPRLNPKVQ